MFSELTDFIYNAIVTIPIENNLSWIYLVLNLIFTLLAPTFPPE